MTGRQPTGQLNVGRVYENNSSEHVMEYSSRVLGDAGFRNTDYFLNLISRVAVSKWSAHRLCTNPTISSVYVTRDTIISKMTAP